jgi:hypothetical protein
VAWALPTTIDVVQAGTGQVTFAPGVGVTINSVGGVLNMSGQWVGVTLVRVAANTWDLVGSIGTLVYGPAGPPGATVFHFETVPFDICTLTTCNATGSSALVTGVFTPYAIAINSVWVFVYTASGGATVSCCMYDASGNKVGNTSSAASTTSTGFVQMTGLAATLSPGGWYYLAITLSSGTPRLAGYTKTTATWATNPIPVGTAAVAAGNATLGAVAATAAAVWALLQN